MAAEYGAERRQFGRRKVLKSAVVMQEGREDIRCLVVDLSQGGARLQSDKVGDIMPTLRLLLPDDDTYYDCRLVHRQPGAVGVEFLTVPRKISAWREKLARKAAEQAAAAAKESEIGAAAPGAAVLRPPSPNEY